MSRLFALSLLLPSTVIFALPAIAQGPPQKVQAETMALDIVPSTVVVYAEIKQPAATLSALEKLPAVAKLYELPEVQAAYEQQEFKDLQAAVKYVEDKGGAQWRKIIADSTDGGVTVFVEALTRSAGILVKATDAEKRNAALAAVLDLVAADAVDKGNDNPIQKAAYGDVTTYRIGEARFATVGDWLVITNNNQLGKTLIDAINGDQDRALSGNKRFVKAAATKPADADVWVYVDLATVRLAGVAEKAFSGKTENIVAELLAGGVSADLKSADYVTASLAVDESSLTAKVVLPHTDSAAKEREYFFGSAPLVPERDDAILTMALKRDLGAMWSAAPDVLEEKGATELENARGGLTTIFAGRDFAEEIVGNFGSDWQFVLVRQTFEDEEEAPNLKLPAGAVVTSLKDADKVRREFKVAFQSAIGILNVAGAQEGNRQLELHEDAVGEGRIYYGTFLPPADDAEEPEYDIYGNFSPALVLNGDQFILASTHKLARELVAATDTKKEVERLEDINTRVAVNVDALRKVLEDNQNQLIAQNMLEKGHDREDAEAEIGTLFDLLSTIRSASVQLRENPETLELEIKVESTKE